MTTASEEAEKFIASEEAMLENLTEIRKGPDEAYDRLMKRVEEAGGRDLATQLDYAVDLRIAEAEGKAVKRQGHGIMALIAGDAVVWGDQIHWDNRPEDS